MELGQKREGLWIAPGVLVTGFGIAFDGSTLHTPLPLKHVFLSRPVQADCYSIFLVVTLQLFFSLVVQNQKMMEFRRLKYFFAFVIIFSLGTIL